jgi:hypothetical protein
MRNILVSFGLKEKNISWSNLFDNIYFLPTEELNIGHVKDFFENKLVLMNNNDNIFFISNGLILNDMNKLEKIIKFSHMEILEKYPFLYLWNYMQDCDKLKLIKQIDEILIYENRNNNKVFALGAKYKYWQNIISKNRFKDTRLEIILNKKNINSVFFWPPVFSLSIEDMNKNNILGNFCQQSYQPVLLKHNINSTAKKWFILAFIITLISLYLIYKKTPYPRYFLLRRKDNNKNLSI